jgi:hypothetical protein
MAEDATGARQSRTAGFPVMTLKEVVEALANLANYGVTHSRLAIATQLGHSTDASGPFKQKLAAFREFKLLTTRDRDRVALTDLARSIVFPTSEVVRRIDLQQAFKACGIFAEAYDRLAKGVELDSAVLGNLAVRDLGVSPPMKQSFSKSFVDSAVYASLAEDLGGSKFRLLAAESPPPGDSGKPGSQESHPSQRLPPSLLGRQSERTQGDELSSAAPVLDQRWAVDGGEVRLEIRLSRALPSSVYGALATVAAELEKLAALLGQPAELGKLEHADHRSQEQDR